MKPELALAVVSLLVAVLGLAVQHLTTIASIKERLTRLETRTELFWALVEKHMATLLHSPGHHEKDRLLSRFHELTSEELIALREILQMEAGQNARNPVLIAYCLLLARIEQRLQGVA